MLGAIERDARDRLDVPTAAAAGAAAPDLWLVRAALALAVAPLAVAAVHLAVRHGGDYHPFGDTALTELVTRDVGRRAVLLGPYSRDGWFHPGPAVYYALAVPYRLLGSLSIGMNVGALALNAVSVIGMAVIARRRGGTALMLITLLACALLLRSLGPEQVRLHWNPYLTVLPYGLLVFLTWALACSDRWALPLAVAVASFLAQTHVGYVALALPLLVLGVVWLLASVGLRGARVPTLIGGLVGLAMWLPPVIEQLTHEPGNLTAVVRWFRDGGVRGEQPRGLGDGWRVVSAQYGLPPEWLFGHRGTVWPTREPVYLYQPLVPVLLAVMAGAMLYLWRRRPAGARQLVAVWCVGSMAGIVATTRTIGPVYAYRLGWAWVLGMVGGVIVAWAAWELITTRRPDLERRVLVPVGVLVLATLAVVGSLAHVRAGEPQGEQSRRLRDLMPGIVEGLPPGDGDVVVRGVAFGGLSYAPSVVLQLERRGIEGRMPAGDDSVGTHRMHGSERPRARLVVVTDADIPAFEVRPSSALLAYSGDLPRDELRARVAAATAQASDVAGDSWSAAGSDETAVRSGSAVAVFIEQAAAAPE